MRVRPYCLIGAAATNAADWRVGAQFTQNVPNDAKLYPQMTAIFISYRRRSAPKDARMLFERLINEFGRDSVFLDHVGIFKGEEFARVIARELATCQVMLVLIDPEWLRATDEHGHRRLDQEADFVRTEIATALERDMYILPVLTDGAKMPQADELPAILRRLTGLNPFRLDIQQFDVGVNDLCQTLRRKVAQPAVATGILDFYPIKLSETLTERPAWRADGDIFRRDFEFDAPPVFEITVTNRSAQKLVLVALGVRLLERKAGSGGGCFGFSEPLEVDAEFAVCCPEAWKASRGPIDERAEVKLRRPVTLTREESSTFALKLENFCVTDSSTSSEIRFYIKTMLRTVETTAESKSIWLEQ
jgi:hypothetical protein